MFTAWSATRSRSGEILVGQDDETEVAGEGALAHDQLYDVAVHLDLPAVDQPIPGDRLLRQGAVSVDDGADRQRELMLHLAGHRHQDLPERRQLPFQRRRHGASFA